ncbi:MAG: hypothetical protein HY889_04660 [Deltaproteobacteria bacterium]|nr:hypothetical protein [Deltaproteobacteria bacterium]
MMTDLICIRCEYAAFLDPKKDICYKTGGLFCKKLKVIVGKFDPCRKISEPMKNSFKKPGIKR